MSGSLQTSARKVAKSLKKMGYDAICVGDLDLSANYYKDDIKPEARLPFISANAVDGENNRPFLPFTSVKAGNYTIGITALAAPTKGRMKYTSSSWKKSLKTTLPVMTENFDFIILLSSLTTKENKRIAQDFPGINVIISADDAIGNLSPSLIGSTLITQTGTLGQYIGVLDLEIDSTKKWKKNYFTINSLKRKQHSIPKKITRLKKDSGSNKAHISELEKELADLPNNLKKAKKELADQKGSSFTVEFVPIETTIEKDPRIEAILK